LVNYNSPKNNGLETIEDNQKIEIIKNSTENIHQESISSEKRPLFSNFLNMLSLPKILQKDARDSKIELVSKSNQIESFENTPENTCLIDYGKYQLVMPKNDDNIGYFEYLNHSNDSAVFPLYQINQKLVKLEPIDNETLLKRTSKIFSKDSATFDNYSDWNTTYTTDYINTLKNNGLENN
jgi:hypothetical protein